MVESVYVETCGYGGLTIFSFKNPLLNSPAEGIMKWEGEKDFRGRRGGHSSIPRRYSTLMKSTVNF